MFREKDLRKFPNFPQGPYYSDIRHFTWEYISALPECFTRTFRQTWPFLDLYRFPDCATSPQGGVECQKKPFLNWPSEFNVKIPLCLDIHHAWQTLCNVLTVKMSICRYGDRDLRTREGREGRVAITVGRSVLASHLTRHVTRPYRHRFLLS